MTRTETLYWYILNELNNENEFEWDDDEEHDLSSVYEGHVTVNDVDDNNTTFKITIERVK